MLAKDFTSACKWLTIMCVTLKSCSVLFERVSYVCQMLIMCAVTVTSPFNFHRAQSFLATMATVHDKWHKRRNNQGVCDFSFNWMEKLERLLIHWPKMYLL